MRQKEEPVVDTALTRMYHHRVSPSAFKSNVYEWVVCSDIAFDELILSWNGSRPSFGSSSIYIAVETKAKWSPYLLYAGWGAAGQFGGDVVSGDFGFRISQDIVEMFPGWEATGFKIRLEVEAGASLENIYSFHACVSSKDLFQTERFSCRGESVNLQVPLVSQFSLDHPRKRDLCSPSSTSSIVGYLKNQNKVDPAVFANRAHDDLHDIYGNWVLNIAHASDQLGKSWECWVERLNGFEPLYESLCKGIPVVVSVKGSLPGASLPYANGHLIVVKGYDQENSKVLCMDPAFHCERDTDIAYPLDDFLEAWGRRRNLAYIFQKISSIHLSNMLSIQK